MESRENAAQFAIDEKIGSAGLETIHPKLLPKVPGHPDGPSGRLLGVVKQGRHPFALRGLG